MEIGESGGSAHCALGLLVSRENGRSRATHCQLFQELQVTCQTRDKSKASGCGWLEGGRPQLGTSMEID